MTVVISVFESDLTALHKVFDSIYMKQSATELAVWLAKPNILCRNNCLTVHLDNCVEVRAVEN